MGGYTLGKKNYKRTDISDSKTAILDIDSLLVLKNDNTDDHCFNAVHKQYFSKKSIYALPVIQIKHALPR